MTVVFILPPVIRRGKAAARKDWGLSWYLDIFPIANPWVGCEGMPVDDGGGKKGV